MAKSKTNASHQARVIKFKQNIKKSRTMSELKYPESPIAQQYPTWDSKEKMEITGLELESITNYVNLAAPAVMAINTIFQRNVENGKIKWKFVDKEGKELPEDVVKNYEKELQGFFLAQQSANKPITAEEQTKLPRIDALVDPNGNEIT